MSDSITKDTQNTASVKSEPAPSTVSASKVLQPAPTAPTTAVKSSKSKNKSKPRRTRNRRRAAASDNDSADQSDNSLSSRSDAAGSDTDDEPAPQPKKASTSKSSKAPVFPDVSSITPAGWAEQEGGDVKPISFEDFNAGKESAAALPARGTGLSIRGRGKGRSEPVTKREYTPEETAKYELQKAKRKEKAKAKREALKEEKVGAEPVTKSAPNGEAKPSDTVKPPTVSTPTQASATNASKPAKAKGKKKTEMTAPVSTPASSTIDAVTASTSALTLDTPTEPSVPAASTSMPEPTAPVGLDASAEVKNGEPAALSTQSQPPRGPRGNTRAAQTERVATDPKFTPRAGQFWTHDQRLSEGGNAGDGSAGFRQMNPFWRGRAVPRGAFRGIIRGRGRGGAFFPNGRGGFVNGGPSRSVELTQGDNKEEGSSKLRMDREYELAEARDKARTEPKVPVTAPATVPVEQVVEVAQESEVPAAAPAPAPTTSAVDRKWGHEGYEAMSTPGQFRGGFRGAVRGARGRGAFFPRGGHLPFAPVHRQMRPAQLATAAKAAAVSPAISSGPPAPVAPVASKTPAVDQEKSSTQPTADSLLDPAEENFKIKFPGSAASVVPAAPSPVTATGPIPDVPTPIPSEASGPAKAAATPPPADSIDVPPPPAVASTSVPKTSQEPTFPSLQSNSPAPVAAVQAQMYTGSSNHSPFTMGSENGSVGSAHFVPHPGHVYAPGMTSSGEFVPSGMSMQHQRPAFYPQQSQRGYPNQNPQYYPPQSPYSPGPYDQHLHHQQRGSFSGAPMASPQGIFYAQQAANVHVNGRSSPLNPYMNQVGGYFAPPRSAHKVAIRAPAQNPNESNENVTNGSSSAGAHSNANGGSVPNGGAYYGQHYNPYVQPFVPGQQRQDETVYYPTHNGQQYAWQGYNGEQYYDGNVAYGY